MKYRILGAVTGLGLAVGLFYGLESVLEPQYVTAVAVGTGTGAFLVVDGSAGAGDSEVYHQARQTTDKLQDASKSIGGGVLAGFALAMLSATVALGELGGSLLAGAGALLAANFVYLYRRPAYEEKLAEMREEAELEAYEESREQA